MKKCLVIILALCFLLVGCGKKQVKNTSSASASDSSVSASDISSSETSSEVASVAAPSSQAPASSTTQTTPSKAASKPQTITDNKYECIKLDAFMKSTQAQLDQMLKDNFTVSLNKDAKYIPSGSNASIKLTFNKNGWGQFLDMTNAGKSKVVDPFPDPLVDYEGIRFWMNVIPSDANGFDKVTVMVGDWGYGYRTIFQKDVTIPAKGFKGYIDVRFDEMTDFYGTSSPVDPSNMDYIGFKFTKANGCTSGADVYISDLQAFRTK